MMKSNQKYNYSEISSFEDLRLERERLIFRSRLIESKLSLNYLHIREMYSVSNLFFSFAKETILPKISDFIGELIRKVGRDPDTETGKEQEVEV
jgi:hypothetical protein